jgi:plasmid maintenance system antidote protein VapI
MAAMGRGGGKTPDRVITKLREEVDRIGQNATARAIGIPLYSVQKYLKGTAEPTTSTIGKIAEYFDVSAMWLRWEDKRIPDVEKTRAVHERMSESGQQDLNIMLGGTHIDGKDMQAAGFEFYSLLKSQLDGAITEETFEKKLSMLREQCENLIKSKGKASYTERIRRPGPKGD